MTDPIPFPGGSSAVERGERISSDDLDWSEFHKVNDVEALGNLRIWAYAALQAAGAKVTGSGMGFGAIDMDIELQGCRYNVSLKPLRADPA